MHEYIRETSSWKYDICKCCEYRTSFTCIRCKYCWSCHWKKERLEKNELLRNRNRLSANQGGTDQVNNKTIPTGVSQYRQENEMVTIEEHYLLKRTMINVFGEEEPDPICTQIAATSVKVLVAVDIHKTP